MPYYVCWSGLPAQGRYIVNVFDMTLIQSIIIAVIEGLTEFLPISSTAHMRLAQHFMGLSEQDPFTKMFTIAIQLGAILSVVVLYRRKFLQVTRISFYVKLAIAMIPSVILGALFHDKIDALLEKPVFIACIMIAGGVLFLFIEKMFRTHTIDSEEQIGNGLAFRIGMFQCLAILFPGLSRSAATIIGGMSMRLTRAAAAEFSFFLAVPTMLAATIFKILKFYSTNGGFTGEQLQLLLVGNLVAFLTALMAIRFFIGFLQKHGFPVWGYYRIIVGLLLLALLYFGPQG